MFSVISFATDWAWYITPRFSLVVVFSLIDAANSEIMNSLRANNYNTYMIGNAIVET